MENLEWILGLLGAIITFIGIAIPFVIKLIDAIKEMDLNKLRGLAEEAIAFAETKNVDGQSKKEIALAWIQTRCPTIKVKFVFDTASKIIEEIIKLTKTVNARDKDLEKNETEKKEVKL